VPQRGVAHTAMRSGVGMGNRGQAGVLNVHLIFDLCFATETLR
jgi:hypothetical protein